MPDLFRAQSVIVMPDLLDLNGLPYQVPGTPYRVVLSVDEITAFANEVSGKAGFIGRENVAWMYRELGWSKFGLERKVSHAVLSSKASSVGQHPHAGRKQARGPVTSRGRREVVAGLSIQAWNLCLLFCRPTPPYFFLCATFTLGGGDAGYALGRARGRPARFGHTKGRSASAGEVFVYPGNGKT